MDRAVPLAPTADEACLQNVESVDVFLKGGRQLCNVTENRLGGVIMRARIVAVIPARIGVMFNLLV